MDKFDWRAFLDTLPEKQDFLEKKQPFQWENEDFRELKKSSNWGYDVLSHDEFDDKFKDVSGIFKDASIGKLSRTNPLDSGWTLSPEFEASFKESLLSSAFAVAQQMGRGTATQIAAPQTARFVRGGNVI